MPVSIASYYSWKYETRVIFAQNRLQQLFKDRTVIEPDRDTDDYDKPDYWFERNVLGRDLDWHSKTYKELKNMVWQYFQVDKRDTINVAEATLKDLLQKGIKHWRTMIRKREQKKREKKGKWRL